MHVSFVPSDTEDDVFRKIGAALEAAGAPKFGKEDFRFVQVTVTKVSELHSAPGTSLSGAALKALYSSQKTITIQLNYFLPENQLDTDGEESEEGQSTLEEYFQQTAPQRTRSVESPLRRAVEVL